MSDEECVLGVRSDAEAVVGPASYEPDDLAVGIGHHQLALLVNGRELDVGKVVAHQFRAFNAEGLEAVALLHRPDDEGKNNLVGIERGDISPT